jgi:hypothetical protein
VRFCRKVELNLCGDLLEINKKVRIWGENIFAKFEKYPISTQRQICSPVPRVVRFCRKVELNLCGDLLEINKKVRIWGENIFAKLQK